ISEPKSIIQIGSQNILIQCGIDYTENILILVYQSLVENYFDVKITRPENIQSFSFGTSYILAQSEIPGEWVNLNIESKESTRTWIIPFLPDNNFFIASHILTNNSTKITQYSFNQDLTLTELGQYQIPFCFAFTNINDYTNFISIVLCAQKPIDNQIFLEYSV
ncbi:hypothetical protein HZS_7090, partial [Henneguya salminicola]